MDCLAPPEFNFSMYLLLLHCWWHPIIIQNCYTRCVCGGAKGAEAPQVFDPIIVVLCILRGEYPNICIYALSNIPATKNSKKE